MKTSLLKYTAVLMLLGTSQMALAYGYDNQRSRHHNYHQRPHYIYRHNPGYYYGPPKYQCRWIDGYWSAGYWHKPKRVCFYR